MNEFRPLGGLPLTALALSLVGLGCLGACTGTIWQDGDGVAGGGNSGGSGVGSGGTFNDGTCVGSDVAVPKRIVRLSFNQITNAVEALTTTAQAETIATTYEIGDSQHRTFPPLASPREGASITDKTWATGDKIASDIGKYIVANLATTTPCTATPTAECAQSFVLDFAKRAWRRPVNADESTSLTTVLTEVATAGGTPTDQIQYGIYAVLEAPQFLYRTEFGDNSAIAGGLTQSEVANQLAFFLTDAPPDQPLLDAAAQGALADAAQIKTHVQRILQTPKARQNLQDAMFSYFGLYGLETVIVETAEFTEPLRNSMYHEAELFLANNLWTGQLSGLLTNRSSAINETLAPIYGVTAFPPPGGTPDADGFVLTQLPDTRGGMLTQAAFLTARSRPDQPSVVGRGLLVNAAILCATNPAFPEALQTEIDNVSEMLATATEREKADYRATHGPCNGCHTGFDPYGLALGNFDSIGRFQTQDSQARPINASVTLPETAGGANVMSAAEMAQVLGAGGGFDACMAKNVMLYALAEIPTAATSVESVKIDGCASRAVAAEFKKTNLSFSELIAEVAVSNTLGQRSPGQGAQ
jgi:Protein of unknown function (DUF1592)/Protein of unknown function (DUF1588)/Protein of unknown function (DUF1595)